MYKTETHVHTSEVSPCAKLTAKEMIQRYHEMGFQTVFISDHFRHSYFEKLGEIPWEEKISKFLSGYYIAKAEGEKFGMNVLMSAEMDFENSPNHYLVYGINKGFLDKYPNIPDMTIAEFSQIAKMNNIFVVQAHPYRENRCTPTPEYIDGVEIFNSNPRHSDFNEKAEAFAREHNLFMTAGSDAHRNEDVGGAGILSECEIKTVEEYVTLIKSRRAKIFVSETMYNGG